MLLNFLNILLLLVIPFLKAELDDSYKFPTIGRGAHPKAAAKKNALGVSSGSSSNSQGYDKNSVSPDEAGHNSLASEFLNDGKDTSEADYGSEQEPQEEDSKLSETHKTEDKSSLNRKPPTSGKKLVPNHAEMVGVGTKKVIKKHKASGHQEKKGYPDWYKPKGELQKDGDDLSPMEDYDKRKKRQMGGPDCDSDEDYEDEDDYDEY